MLVGYANGKDNHPFIILGISRGNVNNLIAGKPMMLTPENHQLPGVEILIFFAETEDELAAQVQRVTTVETIVDHRKKGQA